MKEVYRPTKVSVWSGGVRKNNLTKKDKRRKSFPGGDGMWVLVTPLLSFNSFTILYDEDEVLLSPLNLDLRAYNGAPRYYNKVGVYRIVLSPPWWSWSFQNFTFMRRSSKNEQAKSVKRWRERQCKNKKNWKFCT